MKYGRSDLVKTTGLSEALSAEQQIPPEEKAKAEELAADLEQLGPTFIKMGQLLSTRVELLPPPYLEALSRLQDKVEPFSFGEVEKIVNEKIGENLKVEKKIMSKEDAEKSGALHFFGDKYGEEVSVYYIGDYSKEFCGGPHVENTGTLGKFKIVKEEAVSSGVRRIKAVLE